MNFFLSRASPFPKTQLQGLFCKGNVLKESPSVGRSQPVRGEQPGTGSGRGRVWGPRAGVLLPLAPHTAPLSLGRGRPLGPRFDYLLHWILIPSRGFWALFRFLQADNMGSHRVTGVLWAQPSVMNLALSVINSPSPASSSEGWMDPDSCRSQQGTHHPPTH